MLFTTLRALSISMLLASLAQAGIIVSRTGPNNGSNINILNAVSWNETAGYVNVSISAVINSAALNGSLGSGTIYLTSSLGPGSTPASEIAHLALTNIALGGTDTLLFSGLSLGPGTYYLSMASNTGGVGIAWVLSNTPTQAVGAGVSTGNDQVSISLAAYPPASSLLDTHSQTFLFSVAGDPAIPEPGTAGLIVVSTVALVLSRYGRRVVQSQGLL